MKNLGQRIIHLRKAKKMKQCQLASLIGISKMTLFKYENQISEPRSTIIKSLADALDTTTDFLLGRIDDPMPFSKTDTWVRVGSPVALFLKKLKKLSAQNQVRIFERVDQLLEFQNDHDTLFHDPNNSQH